MESLSCLAVSLLQLHIMHGVTELKGEQLAISVTPNKVVISLSSLDYAFIGITLFDF